MRVADIMTEHPTVLRLDDRLEQAAEEMRLGEIRHLPVVDDDGVLVGIVSKRDVIAAGRNPRRLVRNLMVDDVKSVGTEVAAHEAAYLLLRYRIGSVPVTDRAGVLVGIVTETDFVRAAYQLLGGQVPVEQIELEEREAERV
ncbi:CBS domain-containing protein [Haliangium sp.]|uniref:CBS domain-containing protein n=1 Tax=Haliangium sp. TaxID=2663208 RepID=UPI003D099C40